MKLRSITAVLLVFAMVFCMAACGKTNEPTATTTTPTTTTTTPSTAAPDTTTTTLTGTGITSTGTDVAEDDKYGGTLSMVINGDIKSLNLAASDGGNTDCNIGMICADWLTMYNPYTGEYEGRLLESWEHNEDYTEWTCHVRQGVKWHDGEELTAEDIIFTYEFLSDPTLDLISQQEVNTTESYEIIDKYTYKVITPESNMSEIADWTTVMPKHIYKDVDPAHFSTCPQNNSLIGCGPFKFTEYKVGEYIRFDRFDDYWGGKPYLDTIYLRIIPDSTAATAALESGQVDFVVADATLAEELETKEGISIWKGSSGNVNRFYFNCEDPMFTDVRVRQAIAHLIPRDILCEQAMRGFADPAYSDWATTDFYCVEDAYAMYDYSVEKANALLDEAGWAKGSDGIREKDGVKLDITGYYTSGAAQAGTAFLILQPIFEQAGIKFTPKLPDDATIDEVWDTHDFQVMDSGTTMGPDPSRYSYIFATGKEGNLMLFEDDEVTALFNTGMTSLDPAESEQAYRDVQVKLAELVPNIPLWYRHTIYATSDKVCLDECVPVGYVHWKMLQWDKLYLIK